MSFPLHPIFISSFILTNFPPNFPSATHRPDMVLNKKCNFKGKCSIGNSFELENKNEVQSNEKRNKITHMNIFVPSYFFKEIELPTSDALKMRSIKFS